MFETIGLVIAAAISAVGAIVSAHFASNARAFSRDVDRLETDLSERERERLKAEGEIWGRFAKLPDSFVPRREFDIYVELIRDLSKDVRHLENQLAQDTARIIDAIKHQEKSK